MRQNPHFVFLFFLSRPSSFLLSRHGEIKMLPHLKFQTGWRIGDVTNLSLCSPSLHVTSVTFALLIDLHLSQKVTLALGETSERSWWMKIPWACTGELNSTICKPLDVQPFSVSVLHDMFSIKYLVFESTTEMFLCSESWDSPLHQAVLILALWYQDDTKQIRHDKLLRHCYCGRHYCC